MVANELQAAHRLGEAFLALLKAAQSANATALTSEVQRFVHDAVSQTRNAASENRKTDWMGNKEPIEPEPLLVGAYQAAELLSISRRLLWNISAPRGPIPVVKIQGRTVYAVRDIEEYIESQKTRQTI